MKQTNENPSLLRCLLEDASANLTNALGDVLGYVMDFAETCGKVQRHLNKKKRSAGKM
jgi:hypothetical protein